MFTLGTGRAWSVSHGKRKEVFRSIHTPDAQILLLEAASRVLPPYPPSLSEKAKHALEHLGVTVRLDTAVARVEPGGVVIRCGDREEHIAAHTVLWAAGVQASPLAALLARATGASLDRNDRIVVQPDLTLPNHPEIFVIGDMVHVEQDGALLPGIAPVAMSEGRYVAHQIARRLANNPSQPYRYFEKGQLATIGRSAAVADIRGIRFAGFFAWLTWLFVHLVYLVEFENRVLVMVQWAWSYFTFNRGARLITGDHRLPLPVSNAEQVAYEQKARAS